MDEGSGESEDEQKHKHSFLRENKIIFRRDHRVFLHRQRNTAPIRRRVVLTDVSTEVSAERLEQQQQELLHAHPRGNHSHKDPSSSEPEAALPTSPSPMEVRFIPVDVGLDPILPPDDETSDRNLSIVSITRTEHEDPPPDLPPPGKLRRNNVAKIHNILRALF
jgi:hypothetical protein